MFVYLSSFRLSSFSCDPELLPAVTGSCDDLRVGSSTREGRWGGGALTLCTVAVAEAGCDVSSEVWVSLEKVGMTLASLSFNASNDASDLNKKTIIWNIK